jgi:asparagine N-glycosylation enzyme membrane subunit Stt3
MVVHLEVILTSIGSVFAISLLLRILENFVLPRFKLAKGLMGQGQIGTSFLSSLYLSSSWEGGRIQNLLPLTLALGSGLTGIHILILFWINQTSWADVSLYMPICLGVCLLSLFLDYIMREGRDHVAAREFAISCAFILFLTTLLLRLDLRQPTMWLGHMIDIFAHLVGIGLLVLHSGMFIQLQRQFKFPNIVVAMIEALRAFLISSIILTKAIESNEFRFALFFLTASAVGLLLRTYEVLSYRLKTKDKELLLSEVSLPWLSAYIVLIILGGAT